MASEYLRHVYLCIVSTNLYHDTSFVWLDFLRPINNLSVKQGRVFLDKCVLLKDHNAVTPVRLEPTALRSRVKHSTTEPLRSHHDTSNAYEMHSLANNEYPVDMPQNVAFHQCGISSGSTLFAKTNLIFRKSKTILGSYSLLYTMDLARQDARTHRFVWAFSCHIMRSVPLSNIQLVY